MRFLGSYDKYGSEYHKHGSLYHKHGSVFSRMALLLPTTGAPPERGGSEPEHMLYIRQTLSCLLLFSRLL